MVKYRYLVFFLFLSFNESFGQAVTPAPAQPQDTLRKFEIIRAPSMRAIKIDSVTTLQTVAGGGVIIKHEGTIFKCDSAVVNPVTHILEAFGNVVINQGDTVHTFGGYLKYLGETKNVHIEKNVKLTNSEGTLFTHTLDYDLNTGIGNFSNGGKVIDGKNIITSLEGTYYDDTKDIYFKKNVKLDGPKNHVRADSLLYNMQTRKSTFISPTSIKNDEVQINTTEGTYDLTTGDAFFSSRTTVKDSSNRLYSANTMALENKTGNAQLEGNAVIIDSAGGYIIIANQIFLNKKNNSFLATRKPVLIIKQKHDSTYVGADTIFSGFTTFVKNENKVLQKDTLINVNVEENLKVEKTLQSDSTKIPSSIPLFEKPDSINTKKLGNDSSLMLPDQKNVDSLKIESPPGKIISPTEKRDSLGVKDSFHDSLMARNDMIKPKAEILVHKDDTGNVQQPPKDKLVQRDSLHKEIDRIERSDTSSTDTVNLHKEIKSQKEFAVDTSLNKMDSTNKKDTAIRYFLAFHHVKIYNDSLQSVSDSMFISSKDSVFRLYYDPVVWSGNTQINGDTIFLYTKDKQADRLYVFDEGMVVNQTKEGFFNQVAGHTINGYFKDGKINFVKVRGTQSESIYYMQDNDSSYIGMNRATGDVIDIYFKNEDLNKVVFINQIQGKMYPMNQIPEDQKRLKNFQWLDNRRPKSKAEIFE